MMILQQPLRALTQPSEPPLSPQQKSVELIKLTAAGDQTAFAELYDNTSKLLFGLLMRILRCKKTAETVLEQIYIDIWQRAAEFDEQQDKPLTWIVTAAHRQAIALLRSAGEKRFEIMLENTADDFLPANFTLNADLNEDQRLIRSAVSALSPEQREMLELSYFSGFKESEIAARLGCEPDTVRLGLTLAMKKLSLLFSFFDAQPKSFIN